MIAGDWQRRPDKELLCQILQQELAEHRHHSIHFHNQVLFPFNPLRAQSKFFWKRAYKSTFPSCQFRPLPNWYFFYVLKANNFSFVKLSAMGWAVVVAIELIPFILTRTGAFHSLFRRSWSGKTFFFQFYFRTFKNGYTLSFDVWVAC